MSTENKPTVPFGAAASNAPTQVTWSAQEKAEIQRDAANRAAHTTNSSAFTRVLGKA